MVSGCLTLTYAATEVIIRNNTTEIGKMVLYNCKLPSNINSTKLKSVGKNAKGVKKDVKLRKM